MPENKPRTTMSVPEMAKLLGLKKPTATGSFIKNVLKPFWSTVKCESSLRALKIGMLGRLNTAR